MDLLEDQSGNAVDGVTGGSERQGEESKEGRGHMSNYELSAEMISESDICCRGERGAQPRKQKKRVLITLAGSEKNGPESENIYID